MLRHGKLADIVQERRGVDRLHLLFRQTYTLQEIQGGRTTTLVSNGIAAPSDVGPTSMPDYRSLRLLSVRSLCREGGTACRIGCGGG